MEQIHEWVMPLRRRSDPLQATEGTDGARWAELARRIGAQLEAAASAGPRQVHFYLGDGLRWIRVAFDDARPADLHNVMAAGRAIESCMEGAGTTLYFHAMRPFDALFLLGEGPQAASARAYGAPFQEVAGAWGTWPAR